MVTGRYSSLLVGQLMRCVEDGLANIFPILDEIGGLEGARLTRTTRTKEPTQFTKTILDGLWHKHYVQARFIPRNVQNHWRSNNFENRIAAVIGDPTIRDDLKISAITQAFVQDGYAERAAAQRLTGEWIVYASQQGVNHYLTLGNHNERIRQSVTAWLPVAGVPASQHLPIGDRSWPQGRRRVFGGAKMKTAITVAGAIIVGGAGAVRAEGCNIADVLFGKVRIEIIRHQGDTAPSGQKLAGYETGIIFGNDFDSPRFSYDKIFLGK